jgi:hypothetical protein
MKRCPSCSQTYDDTYSFCTNDATPLVRDTASADLGATLVVPPSSDLPPTQVANIGQTPGYQQPYEQPYQQPSQQTYQPQWTPQQQQQWNAPPQTQSGNKKTLMVVVGVLLLAGIGLGIYFLTRSRSSSSDTSYSNGSTSSVTTYSNSNTSTARATPTPPMSSSNMITTNTRMGNTNMGSNSNMSNRFVGTWVPEESRNESNPGVTHTFTADGRYFERYLGEEKELGVYGVSGDTVAIKFTATTGPLKGATEFCTLEGSRLACHFPDGKTDYQVRR